MPETQLEVTKEVALNALVNLYDLYIDLVRNVERTDESSDAIDVFYLRGGLRKTIKKYFDLAQFDTIDLGTLNEYPTLEKVLPCRTISPVHSIAYDTVMLVKGDLKYLADINSSHGNLMPQDVNDVIVAGREILAGRVKRNRSTSIAAHTDITSALLTYEDQTLKICEIEIPIRKFTMEDHVLDYMFHHCESGVWVNRVNVQNHVIDAMNDESIRAKGIYDKLVYINKKVSKNLGDSPHQLFDLSKDEHVKRNY